MNKYGWGMSWLIRSDSKGTRASGPRTLPGPLAPRDRGAHKLISPSGPGVARVSNPSEGVRDISAEDEPKEVRCGRLDEHAAAQWLDLEGMGRDRGRPSRRCRTHRSHRRERRRWRWWLGRDLLTQRLSQIVSAVGLNSQRPTAHGKHRSSSRGPVSQTKRGRSAPVSFHASQVFYRNGS
jgi:hypothetical protein